MKRLILILSILSLTSIATAHNVPSLQGQKGKTIEKGVASWYGPKFNGRKTANGEIFNSKKLTAAHRTLPFGTKVKVVNRDNGKSVIVRINDRGPFAKSRIIDVSQAAAVQLGMIKKGTARVELLSVGKSAPVKTPQNLKQATYAVQIASLSDKAKAAAKAKKFKAGWIKEIKVKNKKVYRVYVGKYTDPVKAKTKVKQLKSKGISGFVKQLEN